MLTVEQIAKRKSSLGASDMPAVLGVSPYKCVLDVYDEKVNGRKPGEQWLEDFAEWGDLIEPAIREWYSRRLPEGAFVSVPKESLVHPTESWATASPDGLVFQPGFDAGPERGLELKNRGKDHKPRWVDHVPCDTAAQAHWGMYVTGLPRWDVVGLINGNTAYPHTLERDDELLGAMVAVGRLVWTAVEDKVSPDLSWVEYEVGLIRDRLVNDADEAAFRRAAYWKKRDSK